MVTIYFLQPAVPKYRLGFFRDLIRLTDEDVKVISTEKDFLNVSTYPNEFTQVSGQFISIGPFFWHTNLPKILVGKSDVLVISGNPKILNYMLLWGLNLLLGRKVIWWGQGWTANSRGIKAKLRRKLMLFSSGIALYTDHEANEMGCKDIPVVGLNNGLDIKEIPDIHETVKEKKNYDKINILFIGRITQKSNINLILDAICRHKSKITLNVIGDYTDYKEIETVRYVESIKNNNVIWHGAIFDEIKISEIAAKCDFFIYGGSVGLSIIHAFSYYLPAIVHDDFSLHMPECASIKPNENSILFRHDNLEDLSYNLSRLSDLDIESMKYNARSTVLKTFNTLDMATRFIKLLRKVRQ